MIWKYVRAFDVVREDWLFPKTLLMNFVKLLKVNSLFFETFREMLSVTDKFLDRTYVMFLTVSSVTGAKLNFV